MTYARPTTTGTRDVPPARVARVTVVGSGDRVRFRVGISLTRCNRGVRGPVVLPSRIRRVAAVVGWEHARPTAAIPWSCVVGWEHARPTAAIPWSCIRFRQSVHPNFQHRAGWFLFRSVAVPISGVRAAAWHPFPIRPRGYVAPCCVGVVGIL